MGLFKALDAIVHGGVSQPDSYEKKKEYTFGEILGKKKIFEVALFNLRVFKISGTCVRRTDGT